MDRLTKEEIQRLVELSKKATQGKWAIDARYSNHAEIRSHRLYAGAYERLVADTFSQSLYAQDAEFIAALVNWFRANHQSLSLESVREEALEEAARVAELHAGDRGHFGDKVGEEVGENIADMIRALQSPARVAEGEPVREALSNLVSLLLQTMEPIGPMRDRKDYPSELQTAINVLRTLPESPAKEQPGEQMVKFPDDCDFLTAEQWKAVAKRFHGEWREAAALIEKLGQQPKLKVYQVCAAHKNVTSYTVQASSLSIPSEIVCPICERDGPSPPPPERP